MWQQDIGWLCLWVGKEGICGFGGLPVSASLIDRCFGLRTKSFRQHEQPLIQALVAQIQSVELAYTPSRINVLSHDPSINAASVYGGIVPRHVVKVSSGSRNTCRRFCVSHFVILSLLSLAGQIEHL